MRPSAKRVATAPIASASTCLGAALKLIALALCAHIGAITLAQSAAAQDNNWWESITGSGSPNYGERPVRGPRQPDKPEVLNDLRPNDIPWRSDEMLLAIEKAIETYQGIVSRGGWPIIPGNRSMRPGDEDPRVGILKARLRATGELAGKKGYSDYSYDGATEAAVARFQESNGLRSNGRVDHSTLAALAISAEDRLAQLKLNHARIRELMQTPPEERYVLVNVPAFQLEAVERYQTVLRHRVITGRAQRETPSLKATIRAVNFFPFWRVPDSVAQLDLIPRLVKEPEYLDKEKIRVLSGDFNGPEMDHTSIDWTRASASLVKFKQDPGPQNALGLVRIDMQNEHGVYMHDTPMKQLFDQRLRPFSAGCVRVQDVFELVQWITRLEPGWEQQGSVRAVVDAGSPVDVQLTRPIPVYFTYITAWAEPGGRIEFRPDVYGRDGQSRNANLGADPEAAPAPQSGLAP